MCEQCSVARHGELSSPCLNLFLHRGQLLNLLGLLEGLEEVDQLLARLRLHLEAELHAPVKELTDRLEVCLFEATRCHRRRADAHAARRHRRDVSVHRILVECNVNLLEHLLNLRAGQAERPQVPQHQVVLGPLSGHLVVLAHEKLAKSGSVRLHLLGVSFELRGGDLLELGGQAGDLVVVGAALQGGEDGEVDGILVLIHGRVRSVRLGALAEEDHACTRAAKRLVRGGRHDVAKVEGVLGLASGHKAGDVGHVSHHKGTSRIADLANARVVPVAWVGRGARHDELGTEHEGELLHLVVVNIARLGVHMVWQRLEVDGRGGDLLLRSVVAVGQVAAGGQIQAHDAIVRVEQAGVDGKVSRRARVGLHVDAPLSRVQVEGSQSTRAAHVLKCVDVLVATIVASAGQALRVLVGEA
mmetsp:Transcript_46937/g.93525  ORF Transcript_46937/g.93525 Transcript_46937/m.93525 type:complete len:415 (+) Transcript_46937:429-1673(+)